MAVAYKKTDTGGNTVVTSQSGKSISSPYTNNISTTKQKYTSTPRPETVSKSVGDYYVRNPTLTTAPNRGNVPKTYAPTTTTATSSGGGGGGGSYSPSAPKVDYENEWIEKIKSMLGEKYTQGKKSIDTMYDQGKVNLLSALRDAERQANLEREQAKNFVARGGNAPQGAYGMIGPMAKLASNWQTAQNTNKQNYNNNLANLTSQYNSNLANLEDQQVQGLYNFVLPVYTNRQNYADSLRNQLAMNAQELDFRKYLATL